MKKILVIEDEPEMRRNLTTILRMENFQALPAASGRIGIELAKKQQPDLILCDVMMPEIDGYGVIAALRADPETVTIPFIFLTAKGEKPDIRAGMNLGADDYLIKPVAKPDLLAAIRSRLERANQQAVPQFKPNFDSAKPGGRTRTNPACSRNTALAGPRKDKRRDCNHSRQQRIHRKKARSGNLRATRGRNPDRGQPARVGRTEFACSSGLSVEGASGEKYRGRGMESGPPEGALGIN